MAEIQIAFVRRAIEHGAPLGALLVRLESEWAATKARWDAEAMERQAAAEARYAACLPLALELAKTPEAMEWVLADRRYAITAEDIARRASAATPKAVRQAMEDLISERKKRRSDDAAYDPYENHVGYGLCSMDGD